ncbi:hypothetical protein [Bradyrhizobium elkanii]|uniref:hypothetical protein n=1 Tax=Bradyrhizobium elkanii TaxID=29448 RepID=UPI0014496060|nr:hypothetical protein [Bradyrhizobium elkanii]MCS3577660.1 hypothetical protein [Bradyrhizobium elkanii]MCS3720535.1 hypothetical protein [Bradyrhizobium elkanii]MCS4004952.1 hypothetical protein [Bradyrhizobium elkanii USDA 61]BBC00109.1 hypothetical protein BE61_55630 [Bradyrhizobium elkanii USDA 61]
MSISLTGVPLDRLTNAVNMSTGEAAHFRPLWLAVRDAGVAMMFVPQGNDDFSDHEDRTTIFLIGDDLHTAKGPYGFHRKSLRAAFRKCVAAVIVACEPLPDAYAAAAAVAAGGRVLLQGDQQVNGSVAIVETQPYREREWKAFIEKTNPRISVLLCTTKEGAANAGNA